MKRSGLLGVATPILVVILSLALLSLGGCSSATPQQDTASAPNQDTGKSPIKVGVALGFTGLFAADAQNSYEGIKMAMDELNEAGGVLGRPLEMVKFDNQDLAPERVTLGADTLIKDKVDVVHAGWAGYGGDIQAYGKYKVPFFVADGSKNSTDVMKKGGYTNIWQLVDEEAPFGINMWNFMAALPYQDSSKKTIAIICGDDDFNQISSKTLQAAAEKAGWQVVIRKVVPYTGTTEWGPVLTEIRNKKPAIIYFGDMIPQDAVTFIQQFKQNPTNSIINFGWTLAIREVLDALGKDAEGLVGMTGVSGGFPLPPLTKDANDWYQRFEKKYGHTPGGLSGDTYKGVMMWAQAVKAVGDPSNYDAINKFLESNSLEVWQGMTKFKFNEDHLISMTDAPLAYGQIQDGKPVTFYFNGPNYTDYAGKTYKFIVPPWFK